MPVKVRLAVPQQLHPVLTIRVGQGPSTRRNQLESVACLLMRRSRANASDASRSYLHLDMRPPSVGAMELTQAHGRHRTNLYISLGCLAAVLVLVTPVIFFLSVFGDPYPRAFVERRPDGLYAQLRACEKDPIYRVEVADADEQSAEPAPFWVATRSGSEAANSVRLFGAEPGFDTSEKDTTTPTAYEVTINTGSDSESSVVVDEPALGLGEVESAVTPPRERTTTP